MKNPFMSMWLSAANRAANTGAGLWRASVRRQQTAAFNEANKAIMAYWLGSPKKGTGRKRGKRT